MTEIEIIPEDVIADVDASKAIDRPRDDHPQPKRQRTNEIKLSHLEDDN